MEVAHRSETAREYGALWTNGVSEVHKAQECFLRAQSDFSDTLQETIRRWPDRIRLRANLTSEFAAKLIASRSAFDVVAASQVWACRCFAMMADEGHHLLTDSQKLSETGSQLLSNISLSEDSSDS